MNASIPIRRVEGHDQTIERFQTSLSRGRIGSAYLFVGPPGIGKRTLAQWIAAALLCERTIPNALEACGSCPSCQQVSAATHPDLDIVEKPAGKSTIPVELLIGDKQHRLREGLCARVAMRPARGGRKIAIIDDADYLSQESANCLLKTLEEPPAAAVLILIGTSAQRQLPTIRSRCQVVQFRPLPVELSERLIVELSMTEDADQAGLIARASGGSLQRARSLAASEVWDFRDELAKVLATDEWQPLKLANDISDFVDAVGKEAPLRRERLALVTELGIEFYRAALYAALDAKPTGSTDQESLVRPLVDRWQYGPAALAACVDRCLQAQQHISANANQATNIEAWIDDLYELTTNGNAGLGSIV